MIGRAAYHTPADILLEADARIYGDPSARTAEDVVHLMLPYIADHIAPWWAVGTGHASYAGAISGTSGCARLAQTFV